MTREEYERLLQSDYWKGYSNSLIKERHYTCADCGRSFPNERNKLQVHHLVYRDVNPWSYDPDELVVLCKECHQRRHGIVPEAEPLPQPVEEFKPQTSDGYNRSYSSNYNVSERDVRPKPRSYPVYTPRKKKIRRQFLAFVCFIAAVLYLSNNDEKKAEGNKTSSTPAKSVVSNKQGAAKKASPVVAKPQTKEARKTQDITSPAQETVVMTVQMEEPIVELVEEDMAHEVISPTPTSTGESSGQQASTALDEDMSFRETIVKQAKDAGVSTEGTTAEILDRINHANVVKLAKQAGVSTEGSTSEILDRINHANVAKQAQQSGVSTEGSTSEILDRINHANVVKQAQRVGVSTEGSTSEILDRINHANVVKQAQRAGVSTEGTTSEILDRINHANVVKQAQRAGVSTEGTTSEILDRINHANVVKQAQRAGVSTDGQF